MTKFIDSYATHQLRPPWKSVDSRCWCFVVRLTRDNVEGYLERYFNGAYPTEAPFVWEPLMPSADQFGLLVVCHQPQIQSAHPGGPKDALDHREVYLAMPVHRRPRDKPDASGDLVWLQPFVLGDSPTVLFGSREIWGMDMALAEITIDQTHPGTLHVYVRMDAIRRFSPRSRSELLPCMHISMPTKATVRPPDAGDDEDLSQFLTILDKKGGFPVPFVALQHRTIATAELNNLKQFRDVYEYDAAVYRAIVRSESTHSDFDSDKIPQYDSTQVKIDFIWSATMCEVLTKLFGLKPPWEDATPAGREDGNEWTKDSVRLPVELAYSITSTVDFRVVENLYIYKPLEILKPKRGAAPPP